MTILDPWPPAGQDFEFDNLNQHSQDETEAAILDQLRPLLPSTLDFLPLLQDQIQDEPLQSPTVDSLPPSLPSMLPKECPPTLPDAPLVQAVSPPRPEESAPPRPPEPEGTISEAAVATETPDPLPDSSHSKFPLSVEIPVSTLITPRSQHDRFIPPLPVTKEWVAVKALMEVHGAMRDDFIEFDLDQFSFYLDKKPYSLEMRSLQYMDTKKNHERYYFDGILSCKGQRFYVQRVEVAELPIGNYGIEHSSVDGEIWVRSRLNSTKDIYYRLRKPTIEYRRFYEPFVWATDLAKHVVDYAGHLLEKRQNVSLEVLKESFSEWLEKTHGKSAAFQKWRQQYSSNDFRTAVVSNITFIWKETHGVHGDKKADSMRLFQEAMPPLTMYQPTEATPALPPIEERTAVMTKNGAEGNPVKVAPTIVTGYIKDIFGHMDIGKLFHEVKSSDGGLQTPVPARGVTEVQIETKGDISGRRRGTMHFLPLEVTDRIQVGDTISTPHDDETTNTKWRNTGIADNRWFGLVQKVHKAKDGTRSFDVTWLYRPAETPCCWMKYPWPNELFLSDHCTCEEDAIVKENEILAVHKINWFGTPETSGDDFFIRQTYVVEHRRWVSLQQSHLKCSHGTEKLDFRAGETVLAHLNNSDKFTEPCEVIKIFEQGKTVFTRLRRLMRRAQVDSSAKKAPANELVYTNKFIVMKPDRIIGRCHVRVFEANTPIPSPYNRKGTGNLFYITHRLDGAQENVVPFEVDFPSTLRQSFDPQRQEFRKLRGMDLYCGSGNFGRGLEDGGAVEMNWAVDICKRAIHTYMANSPNPDTTHPFFGSVDDLLRLALEGKFSDNVPRPGDVDLISAGSPCPGFSLLTQNKKKLPQVKNRSMVASFAAFIDFYRPKYAILENVPAIVQARHNRTEDTLSQLFCAVVGLGYQAQLVLGDAWTHGAPQSRNRVFLLMAAPGLRLPEAPPPSHSHYPAVKARGVGELCNGEAYVRRSFYPTPLKFISSSEATADLPAIIDGMTEGCVPYPDHRLASCFTERIRHQVAVIPIFPYGMNFVKTWNGGKGVMTAAERGLFPPEDDNKKGNRVARTAQGWSRLPPHDVFPTIKTQLDAGDARTAGGLHWQENRLFTLLEGRRAQGFLDEEVLLGTQAEKWRLVGNSVSRHMALALGLKFREAWVGGLGEERKRGGRESTRGVSEGVSVANLRGSAETLVEEVGDGVEDIAVEEQVKREGWEEMAGLVIIDVTKAGKAVVNSCGKRPLEEDVRMSAEQQCAKIQRIEMGVKDVVMTGTMATEIISTMGPSELQTESNHLPQALPSPITSPEKSPERTDPTIVRIMESDEEL